MQIVTEGVRTPRSNFRNTQEPVDEGIYDEVGRAAVSALPGRCFQQTAPHSKK